WSKTRSGSTVTRSIHTEAAGALPSARHPYTPLPTSPPPAFASRIVVISERRAPRCATILWKPPTNHDHVNCANNIISTLDRSQPCPYVRSASVSTRPTARNPDGEHNRGHAHSQRPGGGPGAEMGGQPGRTSWRAGHPGGVAER